MGNKVQGNMPKRKYTLPSLYKKKEKMRIHVCHFHEKKQEV